MGLCGRLGPRENRWVRLGGFCSMSERPRVLMSVRVVDSNHRIETHDPMEETTHRRDIMSFACRILEEKKLNPEQSSESRERRVQEEQHRR